MQITKRHLIFLEEAKRAFIENPHYETYRNEENNLIALRRGEDRDCIEIYKLSGRVGFFAQMMADV
ncbi:hypothetical protein PALU110988_18765 [Paenibacillus lupini]|uniref:hypothetical protein n=1 Tax=Paenibacillus lupini TaxID=1450204 RepID=UPI00141E0FA6|nr:hypothetical protein [Paenibacillus lupini]NIK24232.1 hypothetical protein [Paenibacillus lupini]